jgi:predicted RNase H-like HicB family nuclease
MKDCYIFPAILTYTDKGISIEFPDLPGCLPCAGTTQEAVTNAKEALGLHLWGMEKDCDEIPNPTDICDLRIASGNAVLLVDVYMPSVRERLNNQFVKKTLSIPAWLNAEAEIKNVNLSQVLQRALKEHLQISETAAS